jgi:pyruvate,orthophosphate dikinase
MFFEGDRIDAMREMILAETLEDAEERARQAAAVSARRLRRHLPRAEGLPGDHPLPRSAAARVPAAHAGAAADLAKKLGVPVEQIHSRVEQLHEFNPMLGFRGCRLGIGYPEISAMQARAVFEAAAIVQKEGIKVQPEIMIPLVGFKKELDLQIEVVHQAARDVQAEQKVKLEYLVGTMIEIPRGALTADEIAQSAEFFSFGTNDLTQTGLGMSRDDSGSFLPHYSELEIVKKNPFATIDQTASAARRDRGDEGRRRGRPQARHLRRARRRSPSIISSRRSASTT